MKTSNSHTAMKQRRADAVAIYRRILEHLSPEDRARYSEGGPDYEAAVWRAMRIAQHADMFTTAARKLPSWRRR